MIMKAIGSTSTLRLRLLAGLSSDLFFASHAVHHGAAGERSSTRSPGILPGPRFASPRNGTQSRRLPHDGASTGPASRPAMFLTAMAANPSGGAPGGKAVGIKVPWGDWALAGIVPGLAIPADHSLCALQDLSARAGSDHARSAVDGQQNRNSSTSAKKWAPWTSTRRSCSVSSWGPSSLWSTAAFTGVDATTTAFLGTRRTLMTIGSMEDCLDEYGPWDALIWLGVLITLAADCSRKYGFVAWLAKAPGACSPAALGADRTLIILVYLYAQYAFASLTAHVNGSVRGISAPWLSPPAPRPCWPRSSWGFFSNFCGVLTTSHARTFAHVVFGSGLCASGDLVAASATLNSLILVVIWLGVGSDLVEGDRAS
ncbi:MAG: anion permease [Desulfobacterales bacterium]|nr:anion permease [Desulfobacterales bacterium]